MKKFWSFLLLIPCCVFSSEIVEIDMFYFKISDGYAIVTNYPMYEANRKEYGGEIVIPGSIQYDGCNYRVKKVDFNAFRANHRLKSIIIEEGVEEIDTLAFAQCDSIQSIKLPNSLRIINEAAFAGCQSLRSVSIPDSIVLIGGGAFTSCDSLENIDVPVDYYQRDLLLNTIISPHNQLKKDIKTSKTLLAIPQSYEGEFIVQDGITMIAAEAFNGCDKITRITLPNSLTAIGYHAFAGCSSLENINLPDSVTNLGLGAFENDSNLLEPISNSTLLAHLPPAVGKQYTIKQGTISICPTAFSDTMELEQLTFPEGIKSIPCDILMKCPSLRELKIPESIENVWFMRLSPHKYIKKIYNSHLFAYLNPSYKGNFRIPQGIRVISKQALVDCQMVVRVIIPNSVDSIGDEAFLRCTGLQSIRIPHSVRSLGYHVLAQCSNLKSIRIDNSNPPAIQRSIFEDEYGESCSNSLTTLGVSPDILILIPEGSLDVYKTTPEWSCFTNYKEHKR